ncbi:cation:proton antiporter [Vitreoscilla massiliensis]|uniref:Cation:proton antiporter n=1 Tax=Vitreoscilla massiliensis TaxID=1689272 RepID=A0ABY4E2Z2_9NEIS|nr:cation:proton antiporter [Vitreoscilla massiliensis]UOO89879.1 cation:proton antiporter [Vitreoscilla massiliensis]
MEHSYPLVETIVGGLVFAFILGMVAQRLRMPPLIGYLFAGILVGPFGPGIPGMQGNLELSHQLAELGVILLMFGVGLHFSIKDLLAVRKVALPGAVVQMGFATILGMGLATIMGWSWGAGLVFGLALSCASTVVLMAALERWHIKDSNRGRIAIGWLIVEDIAMVFVLVLIPALAGLLSGQGASMGFTEVAFLIAKTCFWMILFIVVMMVGGNKLIPWLLKKVVRTGNKDLFRLGVLAIALGCAIAANYLFHVSFALGAFFAGMILSETEMNHAAEEESSAVRDFFTVLFFVSVGMLFNPEVLTTASGIVLVLTTLFIIIVGKSLAAYMIVKLFGYPKTTALTIAVSLAQIGEFSFMIASLGLSYKILEPAQNDAILAAAMISIILNPFLFVALNKYKEKKNRVPAHESHAAPAAVGAEADANDDGASPVLDAKPRAKVAAPIKPLSIVFEDEDMVVVPTTHHHSVLIGYGVIGKKVLQALLAQGQTVLVQESRLEVATQLRFEGVPVAYGHALTEGMLEAVYVEHARDLIVTISDTIEAVEIIKQALQLNPHLRIIARAQNEEEQKMLLEAGATDVIYFHDVVAEKIIDLIRVDANVQAQAEDQIAAQMVAAALQPEGAANPTTAYTPASEMEAQELDEFQVEAVHGDEVPRSVQQKAAMPKVTLNTDDLSADVDTPASEMEAQEREVVIDASVSEVMSQADKTLSDAEIEALALSEDKIKPQAKDV